MAASPVDERDVASTSVFGFADSALRIETNSPSILAAALATFGETHSRSAHSFDFKLFASPQSTISGGPPLSLPVEPALSAVEGERQDGDTLGCKPPWPQPYFRGRDHLVLAVYGGGAMLFDLVGRRALGVFSAAMARDEDYWRRVIFPVALGVIAAAIGVTPLHCATLVREGRGLHICGLSGAGKSTLSVALAQRGFALLSDDWTYFSRNGSDVEAYGVPVPIKLLPPAQQFFPELLRLAPAVSLNGELAFEVDPAAVFSAGRAFTCTPQRFIFLDRRHGATAQWLRLSPAQVENQFRPALERMPDCLRSARDGQHEIISSLGQVESWLLICGGDPHQIAAEIDAFTASPPANPQFAAGSISSHFEIPDLMCRFVPAPFTADLAANGTSIRLETNLPELFAQASSFVSPHPTARQPFLCTVLKDDAVQDLAATAACHDDLLYQTIPGQACLFVDRRARRIVAFVTEAHARRPAFLRDLLELAR